MNYLIGLICFLFVAVFSSQTLVDICDTMIVVTAIYLIIKNKDYSVLRTISKTWYFWTGWLIVIFLGLYVNNSQFSWNSFLEFRWFISLFSISYVLINIRNSEELISKIGFTILILNIVALCMYVYNPNERAGGIYSGIMAFSQNMGMVTCFFITYLSCVYKYKFDFEFKKIFFLGAITSVLLIFFTLTRGVWIATILGISVSAFFIPKKVFTYTIIGVLIAFFSLSYLSTSFNERIYSKEPSAKVSNSQRKNIWRANVEIFKDFPLIGAGYSQNNIRLTEYYAKLNIPQNELKSHAHNQYLHWAAGTGLVGLIFYLIFIFKIANSAVQQFFRSKDDKSKALILSLISVFISFCAAGMTESNFSISKNRFLFLFFCAYIISENFKRKTTDLPLK